MLAKMAFGKWTQQMWKPPFLEKVHHHMGRFDKKPDNITHLSGNNKSIANA